MPTILVDNFNSYNDGDLNGQGDWSGDVSFDVQGDVVFDDGGVTKKAVRLINVGDGAKTISKIGNQVADGKITVYLRYSSAATDAGFMLYEGNNVIVYFMLYGGQVWCHNGTTWIKFDFDPGKDWHSVEVEWRSSDKKVRYRVDEITWSSWDTAYGGNFVNYLNRVDFYHYYSGTVYYDCIAENPYTPPPPPAGRSQGLIF